MEVKLLKPSKVESSLGLSVWHLIEIVRYITKSVWRLNLVISRLDWVSFRLHWVSLRLLWVRVGLHWIIIVFQLSLLSVVKDCSLDVVVRSYWLIQWCWKISLLGVRMINMSCILVYWMRLVAALVRLERVGPATACILFVSSNWGGSKLESNRFEDRARYCS